MKKVLALCLLCILPSTAFAMITPIIESETSGPSATAVNYAAINYQITSGLWSATEGDRVSVVPISTTAQNMYVSISGTPGGTASYAIALMVNGSPSALTCTITSAITSCSDTSHTVSLSAGDLVSIRSTPTNTPTVRAFSWSIETTAATSTSMIMGFNTSAPSTSAANYSGLQSGFSNWSSSLTARNQVISPPGTISNLYVQFQNAPDNGAGTQSYAIALMKNGVAQSLTCTISEAGTTCNDTSNSFTVAAGDKVFVRFTPSGTPVAPTTCRWGVKFAPTTDGESPVMFIANSQPSTTVTHYAAMSGFQSTGTTEGNLDVIAPTVLVKNLYVDITTAPDNGAGTQSWTITSRRGAGNGNITCAISEAATTCNDTSNTDSYTASNLTLIDTSIVPANTPTASTAFRIGYTFYVTPSRRRVVVLNT